MIPTMLYPNLCFYELCLKGDKVYYVLTLSINSTVQKDWCCVVLACHGSDITHVFYRCEKVDGGVR